jgi:hypothetical protein
MSGFETWFAWFRAQHGWQADEMKTWLEAAWNASPARPRMYGLTADEWLHLTAEGQDSEVAPCCGDIGALREWLNGLAAAQGEGESHMFSKIVLDAYEVALASHDTLADAQAFPLLHRVLAGVREELAAWEHQIAECQAAQQTRKDKP